MLIMMVVLVVRMVVDGGGDNNVDVDDGCVIINDFVPREAQYEARGTKQSGTSRSSWPV